jgi:hypothetical protein
MMELPSSVCVCVCACVCGAQVLVVVLYSNTLPLCVTAASVIFVEMCFELGD